VVVAAAALTHPLPPRPSGDRVPEEEGVGDLDPAQLHVLESIRAGHHLVVDAPPGSDVAGTVAAVVADAVAAGHPAVVPALPVHDTLKQVTPDGTVVATVDRAALRAVQTPQGFTLGVLRAAHDAAAHRAHAEETAATDDAGLVEALGRPVLVVDGDPDAMKITTPRDLALAEALVGSAAAEGVR